MRRIRHNPKRAILQYLIAIYHPDNFDGSGEGVETRQAIDALNDEMVAKGVRTFVGGLRPPSEAKALRKGADGNVTVTDGPYQHTNEHIGGFWVLDVESEEEALEWGRKAVLACGVPVQVRPLY